MTNRTQLEVIAQEIIDVFEIYAPPVPIETMLQEPPEKMWEQVDPTQLSGSFLSISDRYSPRMSMARLLARHIALSDWAQSRELTPLLMKPDAINNFARMLIMPAEMVRSMSVSAQNPTILSMQFQVPEDEARLRLLELID